MKKRKKRKEKNREESKEKERKVGSVCLSQPYAQLLCYMLGVHLLVLGVFQQRLDEC